MATNPSSSASYLVLDSLSDGSKYGLQIIEHITAKTAGAYTMKKPTLYSCLTRLEKKGLISSSYWGESELGGKRHYYSITKEGRRALEELALEFVNFDFSTLNLEESSNNADAASTANSAENLSNQSTLAQEKTVVLQQDNLFNLVGFSQQAESEISSSATTSVNNQNGAIDNQIDIFSFQQNKAAQDAIAAANAAQKAAEDAQKALEEARLAASNIQNTANNSSDANNAAPNSSAATSAAQNSTNTADGTAENSLQGKRDYYQKVLEQTPNRATENNAFVWQDTPDYWDRMNAAPTPRPKPVFEDGSNSLQSNSSTFSNSENLQNYDALSQTLGQNSAQQAENLSRDDGRFLDKDEKFVLTEEQLAQNQRIYNTSSELNKYRNRKSFSDNQIEMNVVYDNDEDKKIQSERLEQLKASLAQYKQSFSTPNAENAENNSQKTENTSSASERFSNFGSTPSNFQGASHNQTQFNLQPTQSQNKQDEIPPTDDGVFITSRVNESDIPVQKRITPPNIEVSVTADNLPAPRRNSNLEPTYKDMMSKLFERNAETSKTNTSKVDASKNTAITSNLASAESTTRTTRTASNTNFTSTTGPTNVANAANFANVAGRNRAENVANKASTQSNSNISERQAYAGKNENSETLLSANTQSQNASNTSGTTNVSGNQLQTVGSFVDYESLKKYYSGYGISFKEYQKSVVERTHNTNWLNFLSSTILLLLSAIGCAVIFGIVYATHHLAASSNFLYYTVPAIFLIYSIYTFVKHKVMPSKKAAFSYGALVIWAIFALALVIIFVSNILCGMQYETIANFLTPMLVPAFAVLLALPTNYYIKKFLYNKYAK